MTGKTILVQSPKYGALDILVDDDFQLRPLHVSKAGAHLYVRTNKKEYLHHLIAEQQLWI